MQNALAMPGKTWVKICGNTNLEDALLAADLGADAVGFVFAPSPRQVTAPEVARIVAKLPHTLEKVGVFPDWTAERIAQAVEQTGLTTIQLHGTPDAELAGQLHAHFHDAIPIIQVVHWMIDGNPTQPGEIFDQVRRLAERPEIQRILIDSKAGSATGGTGISFNWQAAQLLFAAYPKMILAGGLKPDNIRAAIAQLQPWGVDVASGVEIIPGKKDPHKLAAFLKATYTRFVTAQL